MSFNDPGGAFTTFYDGIETNLVAAGRAWGKQLIGHATFDIEVEFDPGFPSAAGASVSAPMVDRNGPFNVLEMGMSYELRTGIDPNGSGPDGRVVIGTGYLQNELWFDPRPKRRMDPVPGDRTDAVSVFLHEFGHMLGFNGWRDDFDGSLPGTVESLFDLLVRFDGTDFFFNGSSAMAEYGTPVPLTFGNIYHLGNRSPRPGAELRSDLMNGVVFLRGTRYEISPLDVAALTDAGVPTAPEPASVLLLVVTAAAWSHGQRARRFS